MKTKQAFKLPSGKVVPEGTELHFSTEGQGYFDGESVELAKIPKVALEELSKDDIDNIIKVYEEVMSWNGASVQLIDENHKSAKYYKEIYELPIPFLRYTCLPGQSVLKDLRKVASDNGLKVKVKVIDNTSRRGEHWYAITY